MENIALTFGDLDRRTMPILAGVPVVKAALVYVCFAAKAKWSRAVPPSAKGPAMGDDQSAQFCPRVAPVVVVGSLLNGKDEVRVKPSRFVTCTHMGEKLVAGNCKQL